MSDIDMKEVTFEVGEEFADAVDALAELLKDIFDGEGTVVGALSENILAIFELVKNYKEILEGMKEEHAMGARAYAALKLNLKKK